MREASAHMPKIGVGGGLEGDMAMRVTLAIIYAYTRFR